MSKTWARVLRDDSFGQTTKCLVLEERLRSHYESLERAIGFIRSADSKAAPVLALQVALVGTLATRSENLKAIIVATPWDAESVTIGGLLCLYLLFVSAVVTKAALVYLPNNPKTGRSLIYFEDIASLGVESFVAQAKSVDSDLIEEQLLDQIYRVSRIAAIKMRRVRCALLLSGPSSVLWIILLTWGTIR